jgi:hypothetical protein
MEEAKPRERTVEEELWHPLGPLLKKEKRQLAAEDQAKKEAEFGVVLMARRRAALAAATAEDVWSPGQLAALADAEKRTREAQESEANALSLEQGDKQTIRLLHTRLKEAAYTLQLKNEDLADARASLEQAVFEAETLKIQLGRRLSID